MQERISKKEIEYFFSEYFEEKSKFQKFLKKYFVEVRLRVSENMYEVLNHLHPHYIKEELVTTHQGGLENTFELKIFKFKKTWI